MKKDELIEFMKELVQCWESQNSADSSLNKEILLWRERFLDEKKVVNAYAKISFLSLHYGHFLNHSPDELLDMVSK
jgi:hypothetical protein